MVNPLPWRGRQRGEPRSVPEAPAPCRGKTCPASNPVRWPAMRYRLDKDDRRALLHHLRKALGVPIGQTHAAMGLRLADPARIWSAMDSITFGCQADPDGADRILR